MGGERLQHGSQKHESGLGADVTPITQQPVDRIETVVRQQGQQHADADHRNHQDCRADQHRARPTLQHVCRPVDGTNDQSLGAA